MARKKNKTVELEEIKSTIFETAGLIDKGASLSRVARYMAKELNGDSTCPYSHKMVTIIDTLEAEMDIAKEIIEGFIKTHWNVEGRKLKNELIELLGR